MKTTKLSLENRLVYKASVQFFSMEDAVEKIDVWREEYNSFRLHRSLNDLTPNEVVEMYQKSPKSPLP